MPVQSKIIPQKNSAMPAPVIFAIAVLGATAVGAVVMVSLFNPATHNFYPVCMFHALTGLNCPGCGMTRSLYALLHGNLRLALKDNALFILMMAALAARGVQFVARKIRKNPQATFNISPKILWLFLVVTFIFAVVRNLPGFEWLSP